MPAKGWISVRDLPTTKNQDVKKVMAEFKKNYSTCNVCGGKGYTLIPYDEFYQGVSTVKFSDNEELKLLHEGGQLSGETIKKIVETLVHDRKECSKCNGFGFVKNKSRKDKDEKE